MKILWLVNIVLPELAEHLGRKATVFEGWLIGAMHSVRASGNRLVICTTEENTRYAGRYEVNGVTYYITERNTDEMTLRRAFRTILDAEQPDVVHLYGTEFEHFWAMAQETDVERSVVTIQGALEYYKDVVYANLPEKICRDNLVHKLLRRMKKGGESIELQKRLYEHRAEYECKVLRRLKYINGGSEWGNAVARAIHPGCTTLDCGLILRDSFYGEERWSPERCTRHSIYAIMSYPIKGFHMLLEAMPIILNRFPDTVIYAAANQKNYRNYTGIRKKIMDLAPDYPWYLQEKIDKYGLRDHIRLLGYIDEATVKDYLLRSNVFVSPSVIENQSTALGEAMILGVPSVASCVGAIQEMIDDGEDGFIYPFHEPYILANQIIRVFENDELACRFSVEGHAHAQRTYDREKNCRDLLRMYDAIVQNAAEK